MIQNEIPIMNCPIKASEKFSKAKYRNHEPMAFITIPKEIDAANLFDNPHDP